MKDILALTLVFLGTCLLFVLASLMLPFPDGLLFALWIAASAAFLALTICLALGNGQINRAGDLMRAIRAGQPRPLYWAARLLGTSLVATALVLLYGLTLPPR